ncbi:laminin subunit gamma-1-like [Cylas formicarius]|uniref:laminin subunit gamma-1-like n=1 Tax=Cylas formicarius TaxID=197179 RepID=UPI0029587446|nr:laminin subunit gamma-1-like [Cylas formicarius]
MWNSWDLIEAVFVILMVEFCSGQLGGHEVERTPALGIKGTRCYDQFNRPQRCIPEFENAAFNMEMDATNTCGENGEQEYCVQTGITGIRKSCEICYPGQHHARYLTDFHNVDNPTWWQSETMLEGIQYPNQVNLTLRFGKAFDITYIRIWFYSPRPESFYISKRNSENGSWTPYQYYSATCRDTYGLPDQTYTTRGEETRALCTSEYSDISPLRGGNVAFGTLEGRPSAYNFDASPGLQEWVTATEIMVTLDRINTFGDEVFGDQQVLRSYFYAIADVAVGARCKCNGHASECVSSTGPGGTRRRVCKCEHNTAGPDCGECLPFYNDAPWARATAQDAHECKECNCNGFSTRCMFDAKLYEQTGHGGHCLDCTANRDGPNCERCKPNYYMREDGVCVACECNEIGSRSLQCNSEGKCQCKSGVAGDKCDRCAQNHYDFSKSGCKTCGCSVAGSAVNQPDCDPITGSCFCKDNVEGKQCRDCKPGFFNLDVTNEFGCTPCFCYGHSSKCTSAMGYSKYAVESNFAKGIERWRAEDQFGRNIALKYESISQSIGVQSQDDEAVYFLAPERFLGDQRASYNQILEFVFRVGDTRPLPTATDIILEGNGASVTNTIFAQSNKIPSIQTQQYRFRLHEHPDFGWQPRLSSRNFISILTNLTAIKIKGTYAPQGVGFLDDVKLETAARGAAGEPALWMEFCDCPLGYVGQFCESCAPEFRHSPALGGALTNCIPCDCNQHAKICDSETGKCICEHHTTGENCDLCARGYYGNALEGTPNDCLPCGCPNGGPCIQIEGDEIVCTECPTGYSGHRCDVCSDGYYGDPTGRFGPPVPCQVCECNQNIDTNAIGNCNTTTGECVRCIHNTRGSRCEVCLPGFYGNALVLPKGDCKRCQCYSVGTKPDSKGEPVCDPSTGSCQCKPHVIGRNCDQCEDGFFNLQSGEGCQSCNCDSVGALNHTCNLYTGQCYCRPGVTGLRCDHCETRKYGFSTEGCTDCDCDPIGSRDLQCDSVGRCPCLENVEGRRCDRCKENKYDRHRGCVDCPDCYNLVQSAHRTNGDKLVRLASILDEIERRPTVIEDADFPAELIKLEDEIDQFHDQIKTATGESSVMYQVQDIRKREKDISRVLSTVDENVDVITAKIDDAERNNEHSDILLEEIQIRLNEVQGEFELQAAKSLEEAWNRSNVAGQQSDQMTKIAQVAREIAEVLDRKADVLLKTADEAKNKSIQAYEKAKNANLEQSRIEDDARRLNKELADADRKLKKSKKWTEEVNEQAKTAKSDATALLNEVNNLAVPQIDVPKLRARSDKLRDEALRIGNRTEDLFRDSEELRKSIDDRNEEAARLLDRAEDQQNETDELLSDIYVANKSAEETLDRWNKYLNESESIYNDLKDFDTETQKSKDEAEEALRTISDIENIILDTTEKTKEAQLVLSDAEENSQSALAKALQAKELEANSSELVGRIKKDSENLLGGVSGLEQEAESMRDRVEKSENALKGLIEMAKSNDSLVEVAKEKVGKAGKDTDGVSKKVVDLLGGVREIIAELQSSPEIDEGELARLEEAIQLAEEKLNEAKLEEKLSRLQEEHRSQNDLIEQYKVDISAMKRDVDNIEEIVKALPEGCFRRVELEP